MGRKKNTSMITKNIFREEDDSSIWSSSAQEDQAVMHS